MKKNVWIVVLLMIIYSCKQQPKAEDSTSITTQTEEKEKEYPEAVARIFDAHGGLSVWKSKKTMQYELEKETGNEKQTIDLVSRNDLIEGPNYTVGFDGEKSWILQDSTFFKSNPRFYHNLMFYFYAMPFVLADEGIIFEEVPPLDYEGQSYPGFKVSYKQNIGDSPEDNYFLYYDAENYQMQWLGYTVTFGKGEASNDVHYIRYNDWQKIDGLILPKSLTWHKNEGEKVREAAATRNFVNVTITEERVPAKLFQKPAEAIYPEQ
ncbi:hypothetical protein ACJD0Z_06230 [Flavobacteriaceae bacterium M23B6Z8]